MLDRLDNSTVFEQPEWLLQRLEVAAGRKKWEEFSFEERTSKGWLLPWLFEIEACFSGRWEYWISTLDQGQMLEDRPIPHLDIEYVRNSEGFDNIRKCLRQYVNRGVSLPDFLDWLLWGFGEGSERPRIASEVNEFWYRNFNLGFLLRDPFDYFGELLSESKTNYWTNPNAFFPTPHPVCEVMARMTFSDESKNGDCRDKTVCDPCVGTGRMLMFASNYSLRLYGQDIDQTCVKACKINGYLYIPWLVKPAPFFDEKKMPIPVFNEKEIPALPAPVLPNDVEKNEPLKVQKKSNLKVIEKKNIDRKKPVQLMLF